MNRDTSGGFAGSSYAHHLDGGCVYRLSGRDSRDLLQRISTADLDGLSPERPLSTMLTNEKGRVVDILAVRVELEGSLLLAAVGDTDGHAGRWIERFIIMEDARVTDVSEAWRAAIVFTVGSDGGWDPSTLARLPGAIPLVLGRHACGVVLTERKAGSGDASELYLAPELAIIDRHEFDRQRVRAGVPWPGPEIGEHRHPLEARLRPLISFTKGCYVGQEVVARLDSYRKVALTLTRFEGKLAVGETAPVTLMTDDEAEAGSLTTLSTGDSGVVALGFVRTGLFPDAPWLHTAGGGRVRPIDTDTQDHIYR